MPTPPGAPSEVRTFLAGLLRAGCPGLPPAVADHLAAALPQVALPPGTASLPAEVLVSGWPGVEGVLLRRGDGGTLEGFVAAANERALRDLLLAVPRGSRGVICVAGGTGWSSLAELFACAPAASHDLYWVTAAGRPSGAAGPAGTEPATVQRGVALLPLEGAAGRDPGGLAAATAGALARSPVAVAVLDSGDPDTAAELLRLGYRRCIRLQRVTATRRGSGRAGCGDHPAVPTPSAERVPVLKAKDPLIARLRECADEAGRARHGLCIAEGATLVQRALEDGLPLDAIAHTAALTQAREGRELLALGAAWGIPAHCVSEGVMGTISPSRPVPEVLCALELRPPDAAGFLVSGRGIVVVAEGLQNPDNLGMVLRTADALGAEAVIAAGGVDPLHRNCIRAARGAVGRLPLRRCADLPAWLQASRRAGARIVGGTPHGDGVVGEVDLRPPVILIVGNEDRGIAAQTLAICSQRVQIPMAPGQDSLNVGVAAGVLLYEAARQRRLGRG